MKFFKYFLMSLTIYLNICSISKAIYPNTPNNTINSSLELWYIGHIKDYYNSLYLYGHTTAMLVSNIDNGLVKLYFGINSSRDGNFNYMYDKELLLYGNLYLDTNLSTNSDLKIGFMPGGLNRIHIMEQRKYPSSFSLLPLYKAYNKMIVFDGSYMQNNQALSINYSKSLYLGNTLFSIDYIPNLDCNLSSNDSFYKKLQRHLGATNVALNFYAEYNDIGYGVIGAGRLYIKDLVLPKGAEFFISPNIDYLGFGLSLSYLNGFINGIASNFKYQLTEVILCYKIAKWSFVGSYGYNNINSRSDYYGKYYYNNFNLGFNYKLYKNFVIKTAYFYNKTKNDSANQGLALGISFSFNK